jgi:tRNA-guanine transglycosylase
MRSDPERLRFERGARDGEARTGVIHTAHGPVATPAFIPLATKGSVRGLDTPEVAGLGFEMVLGNTFHLLVSPGPERIAAAGGLHSFIGWEGAIVTDSGGFQVFSLAHGNVAEEIKGSGRRGEGRGAIIEIEEEGVRFRSYRDGAERYISPEVSMEVQAALGSDIALAFDECTPYHADRDYTARSTERTHRWLGRCLAWHQRQGPSRQAVFGIVQGGVHEDLRRASAQFVSEAGVDGIAIGGTLGRDKQEMRRRRPSTCSGSARSTISSMGSPSGSTFSIAPCPRGLPVTGSPSPPSRSVASASTCERPATRAIAGRWSRAVPARPAPFTTGTISATSRGPRS